MTALAEHPRLRAAGRLVLLISAIALSTWGVCLVAFSNSMRGTRLGIPIAFWGVLLGYTAVRVTGDKTARSEPADVAAPSSALEPRPSAELVRERDEATRHAFELRLEVMLRRELEQALRTELNGLRRDVAELRGDVLDAVDGRLRMERVEITRIIGSNLAALHDDQQIPVRAAVDLALAAPETGSDHRARRDDAVPARTALAVGPGAAPDDGGTSYPRGGDAAGADSNRDNSLPRADGSRREGVLERSAAGSAGPTEPGLGAEAVAGVAPRRAGSLPGSQLDSSAESGRSTGPGPDRRPDRSPDVEAEPLRESASTPPPEPTSEPDPSGPSEPAASRSSDPFASLPRLSAFRLPDLPAGVAPAAPRPVRSEPAVPDVTAPAPATPATGNGYVGRRRHAVADDDDEADRDVSSDVNGHIDGHVDGHFNGQLGGDIDGRADDAPAETPPGRHGAATGTATGSSPVRTAGSGSSRPVGHRR